MAFSGDLEHLPIVDVIQLLHSTRKTGTLCLKSHKGESQLVFYDGYFVSANHVNNSVRIGQILVSRNAITNNDLEQALLEQKNAGPNRKPLVATLIEQGTLSKDDAYKGLEELIEMTIVEVLTWTEGTFSLDVTKSDVSDEYRYFPETLQQEIFMNAQSILMDALRIYDEKMRDGTLTEVFFASGEDAPREEEETSTGDVNAITADILGLDALDSLDRSIPPVFSSLRDDDPAEKHRRVIRARFGDLPAEHQEMLCSALAPCAPQTTPDKTDATADGLAPAIIMFSPDPFNTHMLATICKNKDLFVFSTDEEVNLDPIIEQSLSRDLLPVLIIDATNISDAKFSAENAIGLLINKRELFPKLPMLVLSAFPGNYGFSLHAFEAGARAVFPYPGMETPQDVIINHMIAFMQTFRFYLTTSLFEPGQQQGMRRFRGCIQEMEPLMEPPEIASILLRLVASQFERSITFVVGKTELIAEKGIGVKAAKESGPTPPMMFKIPLEPPSVFRDTVENGRLFYGYATDPIIKDYLFSEIGTPRSTKVLILPLKSFGRVIALTYGDFGSHAHSAVLTDLFEILARHANLQLDNAFYCKKLEKPAPSH